MSVMQTFHFKYISSCITKWNLLLAHSLINAHPSLVFRRRCGGGGRDSQVLGEGQHHHKARLQLHGSFLQDESGWSYHEKSRLRYVRVCVANIRFKYNSSNTSTVGVKLKFPVYWLS